MIPRKLGWELREQSRRHHVRIKSRLGLFVRESSILRLLKESFFYFNSKFITYTPVRT